MNTLIGDEIESFCSCGSTIQELFEKQVEKHPKLPAIVFRNEVLTYEELNKKANSLAASLKAKNITSDSIVALIVERSVEMIVGILGILKAGGAYLPIDPNYPEARIDYILKDSNASAVLTQQKFTHKIAPLCPIFDLENSETYSADTSNPSKSSNDSNLAYIIYTSGSTGNPKGVMVEHKSVVNLLHCLQYRYPMGSEDSYLLKTSFTFDVSVTELFGWFMGGARLVILEPGGEKDPRVITQAIKNSNITHINFAQTMLKAFISVLGSEEIEILNKLKYMFIAGEATPSNLVSDFKSIAPNVKFINLYGPTEATVYATGYDLSNHIGCSSVSIGKPLENMEVYIVDELNNNQPVGVQGELCIAGACLARGYLNMPDYTNERFIINSNMGNKRMYKTGDLASWLPDGNIEFLGRLDHQIKIRGFRIEMGEVESSLSTHPKILQTVVDAKTDSSENKYLCAYYTSAEELAPEELREHLGKNLPEYMMPSFFVRLKEIPVNASGKLDRKSLPEPDRNKALGSNATTAQNEIEQKLLNIWSETLGIEASNIGISDNFFHLGGYSLLLIQMHEKIEKEFPNLLTITDYFTYPTIEKISEYIESKQDGLISFDFAGLPSEYFSDNLSGDLSEFKYEFGQDDFAKIIAKSSANSVSHHSILMSMFAYLLSKVGNSNKIVIQEMIGEKESVKPIFIDLEDLKSESKLFGFVDNKTKSSHGTYKIENVLGRKIEKSREDILPLFCEDKFINNSADILSIYDLVMSLNSCQDNLTITCYHNNRFVKDKVRELFNLYIKFIKANL